ncbi:hypothetical protein C7C56_014300 [Massilia glaciei]|uniref:DUF6701 domain-containing protein n=2 Tax=Massilia glaciei TaxID=1524097 RepID=A0A2U2HJS6_9BURK|nr:hypothetical protein C7C56_014300 [Massilia glaciei]
MLTEQDRDKPARRPRRLPGLRAALAALLLWLCVAPAALAAFTVNYITINGVATRTIPAGTFSVTVNVTLTEGWWWRSTIFSTSTSGISCHHSSIQPNYRYNGTHNWTYNMNLPTLVGQQLLVQGTRDPNCTGIRYALTPNVLTIAVNGANPTNTTGSVTWTVSFSEPVNGVRLGDFGLVKTGIGGTSEIVSVTSSDGSGAFAIGTTGSARYGTVYTVTVSTGTGSGTIGLNVTDSDTIVNLGGVPLGGAGAGNGSRTGAVLTIDRTAPVGTISCQTPALCGTSNPTAATSVTWQVVFSEAVTGVDAAKFALSGTGTAGSAITSVTGSGTTYLVTANTSVSGTLALNLTQNLGTLLDLVGNAATATSASLSNTYTVQIAPALNHVRIVHDGTALTCLPETVTIKACANAACSSLYIGAVSVTPTVVTGVTWSPNPIAFNNGSATATVRRSATGTLTLGGTVTAPAGTSLTCQNGATVGDCALVFNTNSCTFDAVEPTLNANSSIYTKLSGNAFSLDVLALASGAPAPSSTATGTATVMDASAVSTAEPCGTTALSPGQNFAFNGSTGRATITLTPYFQAARNARIKILTSNGVTSCSSDNFALRPRNLSVTSAGAYPATADAAGVSASATVAGNVFSAGSEAFSLAAAPTSFVPSPAGPVTAVTGYNGVPLINQNRVQPSGATQGSVAGVFAAGSLSGGSWAARGDAFTYSEVGYFRFQPWGVYDQGTFADVDRLKATPECYSDARLNSTLDPADPNVLVSNKFGCYFGNNAASPYVGRFVPDHFALSAAAVVNRSSLSCPVASTFTYMGEAMAPTLTLTARNAAGGTTFNYTGTFARFAPAAQMNLRAIDDAAPTRTPFPACAALKAHPCISADTVTGSFTNGVASAIRLPITVFRPLAPVGPFAAFKVGVKPVDSDNVALKAADLTLDPVNAAAAAATHAKLGATPAILRHGRLNIANTYGSELLDMGVKMTAQYWAGGSYLTNGLDNCSGLDGTDFTMIHDGSGPNGINADNMSIGENFLDGAELVGGVGKIVLRRPMTAAPANLRPTKKGSVTLKSSRDYLPGQGRATFGVYKSGPVIYVRETY